MATKKWLKISFILQAIYLFFCTASTACFAISHFADVQLFFSIGTVLMLGWLVNPTGIVTLLVGIILTINEATDKNKQSVIGYKWVWFIAFLVADIILWLLSGVAMVYFTGGA